MTAARSEKAGRPKMETRETTFRVASFQGPIEERNLEVSLERTCEALRWADARDAHVLCMPETYLQGYFNTREEAWEHSIDLESSEFAAVCERVGQFKATLLLGLNERRGVDLYNTVVVIEHNLDVIKTADWVIDLGPEGGAEGGHLVAVGTPEDLAKVEASHTGRFLNEVLQA